jgi:arylsulfatase A-like enzyme
LTADRDYFYGFIAGETSQWYPALHEFNQPVEPPKTPEEGYHLTEDLADKAIAWVRQHRALTPDKPFFAYFAPGATHAPIIGDNGASAEGTLQGTFNEMINFNGMAALETPEFLRQRLDQLGGPASYNHYAVGWAHVMWTPYQWTKQVASHWGGTRNPTIIHWPQGITAKGETRHQFHHIIDVAPTLLEAAGVPSRPRSTASPRHPSRASAWPTASTTPMPKTATPSSTSSSPATAASITRAGRR